MKKKRIVIILAVLLLGTAAGFWFFNSPDSELILKGEVEADLFSQISQVSGKILDFPVEKGQEVKKGDIIAVIDKSDAEYALEELRTVLIQKQAALKSMEKGADQQEIKLAQNAVSVAEQNYTDSQLTYEKINTEYQRNFLLYEEGALAKKDLDDLKYQLDMAESLVNTAKIQIDTAKQQLGLVSSGAGAEEITGAKAAVEQVEVQIRKLEETIEKYTIQATCDGILTSKNFQLGDMVSGGYNLADISANAQKYLVFYISKENLSAIDYNQELVIQSGEKQYTGVIVSIGLESVYTPKNLQTSANKNKDTVEVKLKLEEGSPLKPGENANVVIPL